MTARRTAIGTALWIGPIPVWPPVVLAPMAGITNAPFRRLCRTFEPGGLLVSEMITARCCGATPGCWPNGSPSRSRRDVRKHVGWYLQGYPAGGDARRRLTEAATIADLEAELDRLDPDLWPFPGTTAQPRGKTSGP